MRGRRGGSTAVTSGGCSTPLRAVGKVVMPDRLPVPLPGPGVRRRGRSRSREAPTHTVRPCGVLWRADRAAGSVRLSSPAVDTPPTFVRLLPCWTRAPVCAARRAGETTKQSAR
jgi:hypothetical protein